TALAVIGVVIGLVLASATAFAKAPPAPPAPTRWVTDSAGLLSADARTALDTRLETYQKTTGHQVIVWIAPTLGDENLEEWSVRVFTAWGIGQKGKDDGVALFVFPKDKALRIEVGYGLEDKLPDLYAKRIIDEAVTPELVAGHNDVAIQNGVDQILARLGGDPAGANVAPLPAPAPVGDAGLSWFWIVVLVIGGIGVLIFAATHPTFAWFLFDIITSFGNSGGGSWGGGGGGGGGFSGGGGRSGGGGASGHW
ncbi:MAG TPA: TPM domain-containing protein, partial [Kofleriaceae bacterium]